MFMTSSYLFVYKVPGTTSLLYDLRNFHCSLDVNNWVFIPPMPKSLFSYLYLLKLFSSLGLA